MLVPFCCPMPNNSNLLESFRDAYRHLDLLPLLKPDDLDKFRVDYGVEVLEDLQQLVDDSGSDYCKIIFTGHRACGKSTLLAQFERQCRERYFVVFFSISDTIETSEIEHIHILVAIAVKLIDEAEENQVKIDKYLKEEVDKWFTQKTTIFEVEKFLAEGTAGFKLPIIKGKVQTDASTRQEKKRRN